MVGNIQPIASVRPAASRLAPTAWADSAPNAAMLAATISPTADVLSVAHSTASIFRLAVARCVVFMAKGRHGSERETKGAFGDNAEDCDQDTARQHLQTGEDWSLAFADRYEKKTTCQNTGRVS